MNKKYIKQGVERNIKTGSWTIRRRIIILTLIFCAWVVIHVTVSGADSRTAETLIQSAFMLAGAVIGSYVFGSVWEDRLKISSINNSSDDNDEAPYDEENKTHETSKLRGSRKNIDNPDV